MGRLESDQMWNFVVLLAQGEGIFREQNGKFLNPKLYEKWCNFCCTFQEFKAKVELGYKNLIENFGKGNLDYEE